MPSKKKTTDLGMKAGSLNIFGTERQAGETIPGRDAGQLKNWLILMAARQIP